MVRHLPAWCKLNYKCKGLYMSDYSVQAEVSIWHSDPFYADYGTAEKTIVLIDDDKMVLKTMERMLKFLGHNVLPFQYPGEALEKAAQDLTAFDLIITDMHMPKMDGIQLAHAILRIKSDIPIILCTGSEIPTNNLKNLPGNSTLINKPISIDYLERTIQQLLSEVKHSYKN